MPSNTASAFSNPATAGQVKPWWFWPIQIVGIGLLAHALYLVIGYGMFHFGIVVISLIGLIFVGLILGIRKFGWLRCREWLETKPLHKWIWRLSWITFFVWLMSVFLFFSLITANDHDVDVRKLGSPKFILILGSGTPNCQVSKTLAARLDVGLKMAQFQPLAKVMVSGGQDFGLKCTEGQVMAEYLRVKGLDSARIVLEERSTSTFENFKFSLPIMQALGFQLTDTLLVVTSDFHTLRARYVAYNAGFTSVASASAPMPLYARYTAWLREYFTYASGLMLGEF
jgi:uncharacterized SAM-binding protein YcdF (DUF218 family)